LPQLFRLPGALRRPKLHRRAGPVAISVRKAPCRWFWAYSSSMRMSTDSVQACGSAPQWHCTNRRRRPAKQGHLRTNGKQFLTPFWSVVLSCHGSV